MDEPMKKPELDRFGAPKKLHYITIASFLFGLAFCLPHGIVTGAVAPALGLIPLGIGAILALYRADLLPFTNKKNANHEYQIILGEDEDRKGKLTWESVLLALLDFGCFGGLVVTVVFSIILNNEPKCHYSYSRNVYNGVHYSYSWSRCTSMQPMLAAWATMVMIVNALVHLYLFVKFLPKLWPGGKKQTKAPVCSRCQAPIVEGGRLSPKHDEHNNPSSSMASAA